MSQRVVIERALQFERFHFSSPNDGDALLAAVGTEAW
jgi:hypothetical protein